MIEIGVGEIKLVEVDKNGIFSMQGHASRIWFNGFPILKE